MASALLLALAFAGLWPLVFVALIPWFASLQGATPRQAWNRGYGFGLLFSLTQLWWLGDLAFRWTGSAFLGIVPWLLASLMSAVYYGLLGRLVRSCSLIQALWAIPLAWAGMEVFRSYIPVLAFPWALLAEPLMSAPVLVQDAWLGTIVFVSALVVAINGTLAHAWVHLTTRPRDLGLAAGFFTILLIGAVRPEGGETLGRVAAGQPGVDLSVPDGSTEYEITPAVDALAAEAKDVDLMILPEGIVKAGGEIPPHVPFRVPDQPPMIFGGQRGTKTLYQSAFAHDHGQWSYADKTRLVIFGEFVPGRDFLPFLAAFDLPTGDLSAGERIGSLKAAGHTVGPLICFEALFPDLGLRQARSGADLLVVMSIDDWFAMPARLRLARAAQWRAVEAGLPLVRAASLGRSMVISSKGGILADAPYGERRLVTADVRRGSGPFAFVWLFPAAALGSLLTIPAMVRVRKRNRSAV